MQDTTNNQEKTLDYYNANAESFASGTQSVDFRKVQDLFLSYLHPAASILDFGCGAGRDTKYFLEKGYRVTATDGSEELCRVAAEYTGIPVQKLLFQELADIDAYDAIWACSSILHASREDQPDIYRRMIRALHSTGYIYTSYKYGSFEGFRGERFFTDFDEQSFQDFLKAYPELHIENMWISADVRPGRGEEKWLNIILRKQDIN